MFDASNSIVAGLKCNMWRPSVVKVIACLACALLLQGWVEVLADALTQSHQWNAAQQRFDHVVLVGTATGPQLPSPRAALDAEGRDFELHAVPCLALAHFNLCHTSLLSAPGMLTVLQAPPVLTSPHRTPVRYPIQRTLALAPKTSPPSA